MDSGGCVRSGVEHTAKACVDVTGLPPALANRNCELRTSAHVLRGGSDPGTKRAVGVTYVDGRGREIEQPAELVVLCAFSLHNVGLLLRSKIGKPYDPRTGEGVVGRNYTYQTMSAVTVFYGQEIGRASCRERVCQYV